MFADLETIHDELFNILLEAPVSHTVHKYNNKLQRALNCLNCHCSCLDDIHDNFMQTNTDIMKTISQHQYKIEKLVTKGYFGILHSVPISLLQSVLEVIPIHQSTIIHYLIINHQNVEDVNLRIYYLLEAGWPVNIKDEDDMTPLALAVNQELSEIADILSTYQAKI